MLLHFETPCPSFGPPGRGMPGTPGHCPSLPTDVDVTKCYLQHGGGNAVHRPPGYLAQLCTVKVVHRRASILDRTNHYTNIGHCHRTYWTSCLMVKLLCVKACCVLCTRTVGLYRCWNGRRCRYANQEAAAKPAANSESRARGCSVQRRLYAVSRCTGA